MAPSAGHLLLPKIWRAARFAYEKASKAIRNKLPEPTQYNTVRYQPVYARINPRQPISRAAAIRQVRSRHFSSHARAFTSAIRSGLGIETTTRSTSRIVSSISRLNNRAPFASTLRPNLTGGALGRTAGGYAVGAGRFGGARYFSHGPAAPAQVIHNVSQGVRAFFLSGQKIRFDGLNPHTGEKRFKAITPLQDQAEQKLNAQPRSAPGSHIDFSLSPTITALTAAGDLTKPNQSAPLKTLNSDGLLDLLSVDFARALKDFSAVMNDLKRLSSLGDLSICLHGQSTIRVRFPGCDAETVEQLCVELGIQRGRIVQDEDFDLRTGVDLALLFPFAPSAAPSSIDYYFETAPPRSQATPLDWQGMMTPEDRTPSTTGLSRTSGHAINFEDSELFGANPWERSDKSYSSINISELGNQHFFPETASVGQSETLSFEGVEGIRKFLTDCDHAKRC